MGITERGKTDAGGVEWSDEKRCCCKVSVHLVERGLKTDDEILGVIDGKGACGGTGRYLVTRLIVQCCQVHKERKCPPEQTAGESRGLGL